MQWHESGPASPEQVVRQIGEELAAIVKTPVAVDFRLGDLGARSIGLSKPHELWVATVEGAAEDVLKAAVFCGWRYLLFADGEPLLTVVVRPDGALGRVSVDPESATLVEVLRDLEATGGDSTYQLRYLKVFGLPVRALWLRVVEGGGPDIVIPLQPSPEPEYRDDKSEEGFIRRTKEKAQSRLELTDPF